MMRRMFFILGLVALTGVASFAQARRTVTNSDLEGYRQRRVAAEQELEQNYARMGFGSPEQMRQRNMESQQQLIELSSRLRSERLERERMDLEREQMILTLATPPAAPYGYYDNSGAFYPLSWGSGRGGFGRGGRVRTPQGYFAGGQFWPMGPRTPVRPLIAPAHPTPRH